MGLSARVATLVVFNGVALLGAQTALSAEPFDLSPATRPAGTASRPASEFDSPGAPFELRPSSRPASRSTVPTDVIDVPPTSLPVTRAMPPADPSAGIYWRKHDPDNPRAHHEREFALQAFELSIGTQGYTAYGRDGSDAIGFLTFRIGYLVLDRLSVGIEGGLAPGTYRDHGHHGDDFTELDREYNEDGGSSLHLRASEILGLVRWHFLACGPLSIYGDVGLGILHASHAFPIGARRDNWLSVVGLGLNWRMTSQLYFGGGGRYARLSGDDLFARHRSRQVFDGVQYYAEISYVP